VRWALPYLLRVRQLLLRPAVFLENHLPAAFFNQVLQFVIDGSLTALSLFIAYQLRYDGSIPSNIKPMFWIWMLLLPVIRPFVMWTFGVYDIIWRYFGFRDSLRLSQGALACTCMLLLLRLCFYKVPGLANPLSVIVVEAVIFLLLATGARALRRLITEESAYVAGEGTRLLLIGKESALPGVVHHVSARNLQLVGLLFPGCTNGMLGMRIGGCPVLGDISRLSLLLESKIADLVMITDASLDCIGDVVAVATRHHVQVHLLPSASDVMRGNVRVSGQRQPLGRIERVLVMGGAGYLGSTLVPQLLRRGYKVRVLDRLLFGAESLSEHRDNPNFELMVGDVRDIQAVVAAVNDCDAVVDLAAIVGDQACAVNQRLSLEVNRAATRMLIEICRGYGVRRLVFASTCSVYGASDYLVDEFTEPAPISIYAETKVASEKLLMDAVSDNFQPVILRLGTLFGLSPRPRFDLVVNLLTARAATAGKITIFNGEQWRPFLHVHDAARAFVLALEADSKLVTGEIFNVGDYALNMRLSEVSHAISAAIPSLEVEQVENGDKRNYRAAFDKIHTRLGFRCERTVTSGILEISDAIETGQISDFTASQFNNHLVTQTFAAGEPSAQSSLQYLAKLAA
jgi:nucleoside-diphosphate-sugar epimerase